MKENQPASVPIHNRRSFLNTLAAPLGLSMILPSALMGSHTNQNPATPPPQIASSLVKEFVIAGHGKLDVMQKMLAENPTIINACWDWKNGDFETALEGAGHVGFGEGARWLIAKGARPNIFVLAMLGELQIVKGMITNYPALKNTAGPHGLTLVHHAKKGGEPAMAVLDYFNSIGLKE